MKIILMGVLFTGGFVLLFWVDWRIGVGVTTLLWAHNIEYHWKGKD